MKKIALLAAVGVSTLALNTGIAAADYTLNIMHINDFHSRIEPINRFDSTCNAEDEAEGKCFGGIARVKTKLDERRNSLIKSDQNVIFVIGGDQFQGSLFYTTYKGKADVEFSNGLGIDALALGNHEFDDGPEVLAEYVKAANFPVISGNILIGANTPLGESVKPYVIKEIGGQKVGIVSSVATDTEELSSPGPGILFVDEVRALQGQVAELEEMGVNKIVLVSHVGFNRDKEIAAMVDGIDVIVGGHSNTLLSNVKKGAVDVYPTMVENPSGIQVPIVQAYAYSKYLGELRVTFDDDGKVLRANGEPHLLDASVAPDEGFVKRIAELGGPIEELKALVVGASSDAINGNRDQCRAQECQMGNLVADAMLDRVKGQGVQIAIQNGGGIRASIDSGEITMGEVLAVLPFQNTLATFEIKGSEVVAALENGVSQIEDGAGRFPQVAGLSFNFDASAEAGSRVSNVMVGDGDEKAPIDLDATYKAVSNNFMRNGGDGYSAFTTASNAYDYGPGLEQVVADYIAVNSPYVPFVDGRISAGAAMGKAEAKMEMEAKVEAEVEIVVPQTKLGAGDLATMSPKIEAPAMEKETMEKEAMEKETMDKEAMKMDGHMVVAGDTYWDLAKKYYGDANMWKKLDAANPQYRAKGLEIGATLVVPE